MTPQIAEQDETATFATRSSFWLTRLSSVIFFTTIALAIAGVYLATTIPIAVFPETNFPRVVLGIDNGVMPVEQMQVTITQPLEAAVNSVPGLQTIRSTTSRGSAEISLFFDWHADMYHTLQLVNAAVARAVQSLPPSAKITSNRLTFATFPILGYSLTSNTLSQTQLWELANYTLKPALNRLDGVSTVTIQGGKVPEFHLVPDPARLQATGVTITDLANAVQSTNLIDSPGLYQQNHQQVLGLVGAQVHSAAELSQIVVRTTAAGSPVRVADVADVVPGATPVYTIVTANGVDAVLLNITRQPSANTLAVADEVATKVSDLRKRLPTGVRLDPYYDQSNLVRDSIGSVRDAILIGLLLTSITLVLFLRDWSSSVVAGLVIPVTVCITFVFLKITGQSFNLMTLGGMAAAVGLVIDDAIVMVENIVMHRDLGEPPLEAVRKALHEMTGPLIGSTLTPIVVFLPLVAVTGVTGTFFRALATTMAASLLTSLALALTWTPALSFRLLRSSSKQHVAYAGSLPGVLRWQSWALDLSLRRPLILVASCGLLLIGTFIGFRALGSDLLPEMDEGGFIVDYIMPAGSSLTETNRVLNHVEQTLRSIPEVDSISRRTGLQMGLSPVTEANTGDITVKLKAKRSRAIDDIMSEVRAELKSSEPQLDIELIQVLQDQINDLSNAPEPIQIKLFAADETLLGNTAPQVADAISKIPGVVSVEDGIENTISGPATNFQIDPVLAARSGFTPEEVSTDATAIMDGVVAASPLIQNGHPYPIRIRMDDSHRASLDAIQNTVLNSASGRTSTLGGISNVQQLPPQNEIRRENLQRLVVVTAQLQGSDLGTAIKRVQSTVAGLHLPPAVRVEYGGTYQEQQQSFQELLQTLLLALVLVFGVLLAEFHNPFAPLAILASSVLSTAGVVLALLVTGMSFNVASFMGLIMVIGIVAKNGILILDSHQKFLNQGMTPRDAMLEAAHRRLRPILMTAVAAIVGMLPLALALGAGSQMLQPLAISVIGGLLISMALSLVVTPTLYYFMTRKNAQIAA